MSRASAQDHPLFISTLPAGQGERRIALSVVLTSTAIFLVTAPFATTPLPPLPTFIAIYESALVINDLITAVFLFGQFNILRARSLLVLASGYLFTAFLAVAHALTFPGLFSPTGLLGASPQSTAWLYMFWHAGFPLLVIAYARLRDQGYGISMRRDHRVAVMFSVAATLTAAIALTLLATAGRDLLPTIMRGNHYAPAMTVVVSSVWVLSGFALVAVWQRRPHSTLDLWLIIVLCAWVFDVALSAVLNAGRFDLGFYAGRIYGLLATGFVLVMLLLENSKIYSRLVETYERNREKTAELQHLATVDALTGIANRRAFEKALDQEWRRTLRHKTSLCLLMIDVDFFKRFNDSYGHVAGDHCLRSVAKVLARNARRAGEVAARYGGEEFAVLLPHVDVVEAVRVAQRICNDVCELNIPHEASTVATHVTVSVGVAGTLHAFGSQAEAVPLEPMAAETWRGTSTALVEMADQALYVAKTGGRNRVYCAFPNGDTSAERPAA